MVTQRRLVAIFDGNIFQIQIISAGIQIEYFNMICKRIFCVFLLKNQELYKATVVPQWYNCRPATFLRKELIHASMSGAASISCVMGLNDTICHSSMSQYFQVEMRWEHWLGSSSCQNEPSRQNSPIQSGHVLL